MPKCIPDLPTRRHTLAGLAAVVWLAGVAGGSLLLNERAFRPGVAADQQRATPWPLAAIVGAPLHRDALVVVVHPLCPCSRATIGELETLLARLPTKLDAFVVFQDISEVESSSLWQAAGRIKGATLVRDRGDRATVALGARTSGQTYFFRADGSLAFSGGITAARGHAGANDGAAAITRLVEHPDARGVITTPVYGCDLR